MNGVLHRVGSSILSLSREVGGLAVLLGQITVRLFPPHLDGKETWRSFYKVGVKSTPIVVTTALLTGAIMAVQSSAFIEEWGAYGLLGWGAGFSIMREVGPILIGLMFSGRVGANNTAELGTMKVTEQIDALRTLAIDPISYLIMPRFVAMIVMLVLLTVIGDLFALVGAMIFADLMIDVSPQVFWHSLLEMTYLIDFLVGVIKAGFFGFAIALVSCHYGLKVTGGAVGVGRAVNNCVVASAIGIFFLDYLLTPLIDSAWAALFIRYG
ncbi:MAG: ABC transporter permease [Bradymonadales bacterium]|nr:ABC transporter permease [Bradymonadales bacterium]